MCADCLVPAGCGKRGMLHRMEAGQLVPLNGPLQRLKTDLSRTGFGHVFHQLFVSASARGCLAHCFRALAQLPGLQMVEDEQLHSPKFLRRLRLATLVLTAAAAGGLVMNDWGGVAGKKNVFSGLQSYIQSRTRQDKAEDEQRQKRH